MRLAELCGQLSFGAASVGIGVGIQVALFPCIISEPVDGF